MPRWRFGVFVVLSSCIFCLSSNGKDDAGNWNVPRFTAEGGALYKAASSVTPKPGTDVVVLDQESSYVFDADGKSVRTEYLVYKVLTENGAAGWDSISVEWEPWHAERPTIRARVITPDNLVHPLDPKTITDSPDSDADDKTYGDGRVVRAPLPAIAIGSLVEEEEVLKESAPLFGAGTVGAAYFGRNAPVLHSKLTLDAPSSLTLRYAMDLLPDVKPEKSEGNGRTQIVFEQGAMDALEAAETYLPADVPSRPEIRFSTGASWQAMAAGYAKIVDEKADTKAVQTLVDGLVAGKTGREEKASDIVQYLSQEIRYTGVEFGDAAIIPHAPSETLNQKYGDCKDKATLAVTMLRAAGVPAYVALLNAGGRRDVDAELPGMGMFDHAIVYAPGAPDLWMDLTDEYARLGQLPNADSGRLALIARADSTGLVKIPEATSRDNLIVEKREIFLAENGPARVVETTEPHGVFESQFRAAYVDADNKDNRKNLKDYLAYEYLAEDMTRMERSDPADLSKQFQLTLEAGKAGRGATDLEAAVGAIRVESLFDRLPDELTVRDKVDEKGGDASKDKPKKPRVNDYQLPEAYSYEWYYRIVPSFGFQAKALPPNMKSSLGPTTMSEEFATESDGSVSATIRFDTVKRRFTVAEAKELKEKVAEARESAPVIIYFEPTAEALMSAGKVREAFEANRKLIAEHPKDAVPHLRRAKMLLAGGMGQAARDEAKTATELDPGSALAEKTLAEILEYDLVGRQYRPGSDYAGAEVAFRAAEKLDPSDKTTAGNLAILLEDNSWGLRYGPSAKLSEAIAEYQKLKPEELSQYGLQNNLALALFYDREFSEAEKNAEALNPPPIALIVACKAALEGSREGLGLAHQRSEGENQFKQIASAAGQMLENLRMYPLAADLLEAGAQGENAAETQADAELLRKTQPHEQLHFGDNPAGVAMRFYLLQADPQFSVDKIRALCSKNGMVTLGSEWFVNALHREATTNISWKSRKDMFADVGFDLSVTRAQPRVEGNDQDGYKVTLWGSAKYKSAVYVVKEGGQYKVVGSRELPDGVALEALDRAEAGDLASARVLLDWLREDRHLTEGDDPLSGGPFPRLWTKGSQADALTTKAAAAVLLVADKELAGMAIPVLEAVEKSTSSDSVRTSMQMALCLDYDRVGEFEKLEAVSASLLKKYPESALAFRNESYALRVQGKFKDAERIAKERLQRLPGDIDAMRTLVLIAIEEEDYPKAYSRYRDIVEAGNGDWTDLNGMSWIALYIGKVDKSDEEVALKAGQLSQNDTDALHTLGCVFTELGKLKEAREVLLQAMDLLNLDQPNDNYLYAFGRLAEKYGEFETARRDYLQITRPKRVLEIHDSTYRLAQMRLAVLPGEELTRAAKIN